MRSLYRGIEPIIAVVILVAVTLVLAIGVIGWIMGWWGTLGGTETLQIMPYSELYTSGTLILNITNSGTTDAYVVKAEIVGVGTCKLKTDTTGTTGKVSAGTETGLEFECKDATTITPGARYTIRMYTKAGNVYSIVLEAKSKS